MAIDPTARPTAAGRWAVAAGAVAVMAAIDCAYFLDDGSPVKRMAGLAWICVSVSVFALSALLALRPFASASFWRSPGRWWYVTAAVLPLALVYFGVNGTTWTPLDTEGMAQATIGVDLLRHDPGFGVFKAAYFGRYVARQYVLAGLPTCAFGPSFAALRVGNSLSYVLSYLVFLSALATYIAARRQNALLWGSWAAVMVSLDQYTIIQARMFEQTAMPLGATMMFLAALLYFLASPSAVRAAWVAWSVGYLASGYTPAYATWVLAMGALAYLALRPRGGHRILLPALAQGMLSLVIAALILRDGGQLRGIVKVGAAGTGLPDWLWRYFEGFSAVFNSGFSVIPVPLGVAAVLVLLLSRRHGEWRVPALFLWFCAVVVASLTLQGSFFDRAHYDAHRAMVILPVMATAVVIFYLRHYAGTAIDRVVERIAAYSIILMVLTSLSVPLLSRWYYYYSEKSDLDEAGERIAEVAGDRRRPPIEELCVVPPLKLSRSDVGYCLAYFFPGARVIVNAVPVQRRGCYVLEYNGRPRTEGFRRGLRASLAYLSLHEAENTSRFARVLGDIRGAGGLVADYRFAEGEGSATGDATGHFEPAVLSKGAGWSLSEGARPVLSFAGTGYVSLPGMGIETGGLTLAVWVKWSGGDKEQGILEFGDAGGTHVYLCARGEGGTLRLQVETPIPPAFNQLVVIDAPALPVGVWKPLAVTLSGEEVVLYVDGVPAGRNTVRLDRIELLRSHENTVGRSPSGEPGFMGSIGGLRIYDRALGGEELSRAMGESPR